MERFTWLTWDDLGAMSAKARQILEVRLHAEDSAGTVKNAWAARDARAAAAG